MILWDRPSGTQIPLQDTPEIKLFAESMGWTQAKKDKPKQEKPSNGNSSKRNTRRT